MIYEKIVGIAACDPSGVLGKEGGIPWSCREDLKHFADTTLGFPMIMGYRTFLTLPKHYLKERVCFVFTRRTLPEEKNLKFISSLSAFLTLEGVFQTLYVIGGAEIYTLFFKENLMGEFILTRLKHHYEGDTSFPLSLLDRWSHSRIEENALFTIDRYCNPRVAGADKNV